MSVDQKRRAQTGSRDNVHLGSRGRRFSEAGDRICQDNRKARGTMRSVHQGDGDTTFRLAAGKLERDRVYFAIVCRHADLRITPGQVTGRLGAAKEISFRSCTSMEGLHLVVSTGDAFKRKDLWGALIITLVMTWNRRVKKLPLKIESINLIY